nr:cytochrome c oxidase subunit 3 [Pseudoacanthocephalus sp.]
MSWAPLSLVVMMYQVLISAVVGSKVEILFSFFLFIIVLSSWGLEPLMLGVNYLQYKQFMLLVIVSELMFFMSCLSASVILAKSGWEGYYSVVDFWAVPVFISILLLSSGVTVTGVHLCLCSGEGESSSYWWFITVVMGALFIVVQTYEWGFLNLWFSCGVGGSLFFLVTGFHGLHVLLGVVFNSCCFFMWLLCLGGGGSSGLFKLTVSECVIWYWHFVDVVWLLVLVGIYWFCV